MIQSVKVTQEISEKAALYLSPRADSQHNMLVLALGVVAVEGDRRARR